ncbi:unnamed protein product, partial [Ixodes pacificus]
MTPDAEHVPALDGDDPFQKARQGMRRRSPKYPGWTPWVEAARFPGSATLEVAPQSSVGRWRRTAPGGLRGFREPPRWHTAEWVGPACAGRTRHEQASSPCTTSFQERRGTVTAGETGQEPAAMPHRGDLDDLGRAAGPPFRVPPALAGPAETGPRHARCRGPAALPGAHAAPLRVGPGPGGPLLALQGTGGSPRDSRGQPPPPGAAEGRGPPYVRRGGAAAPSEGPARPPGPGGPGASGGGGHPCSRCRCLYRRRRRLYHRSRRLHRRDRRHRGLGPAAAPAGAPPLLGRAPRRPVATSARRGHCYGGAGGVLGRGPSALRRLGPPGVRA